MGALGVRDLFALVGLDPGQDIGHHDGQSAVGDGDQVLQLRRGRPAVERVAADGDAFLQRGGAAGDDQRCGRVQSAMSRYGLGMPSSTLCSATAFAAASPPFSASPPA